MSSTAPATAAESRPKDPLSMNEIKPGAQRRNGSDNSSNGGNNSEDSGLVSLSTFGFNFDNDEGASMKGANNSGQSSEEDLKCSAKATTQQQSAEKEKKASPERPVSAGAAAAAAAAAAPTLAPPSAENSESHIAAAADAVASLQSIAQNVYPSSQPQETVSGNQTMMHMTAQGDQDGLGSSSYHDGDEPKHKKKKMNEKKREERNAREKERSFRIAKQINELRDLLGSGGVIVPKGTKSSVLTEAANYIRMLQQHQYRSEIDRQQLVQQMQLIGRGAHGPQAAQAIRHIAAQNGVWSLGNFGGVPPKSAMTFGQSEETKPDPQKSEEDAMQAAKLDTPDYRFIFNSCGVAMAIASMGGAFLDCNLLFSQLSGYSKQEICSLTIFNLTARQDLQQAFDQISQLISPPMGTSPEKASKPIVLQGSMSAANQDLGLSVSLVKGEDDIAKCFCVSIVKSPSSSSSSSSTYETPAAVPVSFEAVGAVKDSTEVSSSPAFTTG